MSSEKENPVFNDNKELVMPVRLHGIILQWKPFVKKLSQTEAFQPIEENVYNWAYGNYLLQRYKYQYLKTPEPGTYAIIGVLKVFPKQKRFTLTVNAYERALLALRFMPAAFNRLNKRIIRFDSLDWYRELTVYSDTEGIEAVRKLSTFFDRFEIEPYTERNKRIDERVEELRAQDKEKEEFEDGVLHVVQEDAENQNEVQNLEIDASVKLKYERERLSLSFRVHQMVLIERFGGNEDATFSSVLRKVLSGSPEEDEE